MNFWQKLKKPIFVLAPMADVTDAAFRRVIAKYGKPDVVWTEFVSADGLALAPEAGRQKLLLDLKYSESERPIVAQFFTANPEHMYKAAKLAKELGFDGVDINMGCPDRSVEKQGAGAALSKNPSLARALIKRAKDGAGDLPVSVKIRLGYNKVEIDEPHNWLKELLAEEPALVTIHARTRKEMSKVPARWEFIKRAVEIRNELSSKTLIFGNGDALSLADARKKVEETGCDGVMLGRAIFGNPWLFKDGYTPTVEERMEVLAEHIKVFDELLGAHKSFAIMKKHFKSYIRDFPAKASRDGAAELRAKLMASEKASEALEVIEDFLKA